jgi:hypothetical protein
MPNTFYEIKVLINEDVMEKLEDISDRENISPSEVAKNILTSYFALTNKE